MKVITLANQKGGCGKSTIVLNLAIELALQQYRVIVFDTDPQGSCYETAEIRNGQEAMVTIIRARNHNVSG
ncbi:MAG: ParA family protein [Desulfobacterales bacterium]|nr:ParA family protein [Desulfobacterales bacterium]